MLREIKDLRGFTIEAKDGEIGTVHDFLFQGENWTIRYLVVDTGKFLPGRKVILIPDVLGKPDEDEGIFPVDLTKKQVEDSPPIDWAEPISRQLEDKIRLYFGWSPYWVPEQAGTAVFPKSASGEKKREVKERPGPEEPELRSLNEVENYEIKAADGEMGEVEDFLVDDDSWIIRYMVIDTGKWLPGRKVLVSPEWIDGISWAEQDIEVQMTQAAIKKSPEYDPTTPVDREYEVELYEHYGVPKYWP